MLNKIISNYALTELLEVEGYSLAIADKNGQILWFNKNFKEDTGFAKIKNRSFYELFKITDDDLNILARNKPLHTTLPQQQKNLDITPLQKKSKLDGYYLRVYSPAAKQTIAKRQENLLQKNIEFYNELRDLIDLLVKENSLTSLSREILIRSKKISESKTGLIVFYDEVKKYEILFDETDDDLKNNLHVEKEFKASFSFITK